MVKYDRNISYIGKCQLFQRNYCCCVSPWELIVMWHCMFRSVVRYALCVINTVCRVGAVN